MKDLLRLSHKIARDGAGSLAVLQPDGRRRPALEPLLGREVLELDVLVRVVLERLGAVARRGLFADARLQLVDSALVLQHLDHVLALLAAGLANHDRGGRGLGVGLTRLPGHKWGTKRALDLLLVGDAGLGSSVREFVVSLDELALSGFKVVEITGEGAVVGFGLLQVAVLVMESTLEFR